MFRICSFKSPAPGRRPIAGSFCERLGVPPTGEALDGDLWFPKLKATGAVIARAIPDGPDADFDKARWTLLAAVGEAQTSVRILRAYFLPDNALVTALNLASLRAVRLDIILPAKNNLPPVHWASRALWWQLLERGCHV